MLTTLAILSIQIFQFLEIGDQQQIAAQMSGNRINARQIVVGGIKRLTVTDQPFFKQLSLHIAHRAFSSIVSASGKSSWP